MGHCRGCYGSGARGSPEGGLNGTGGVRGDKTGVSDYPGHRDSVLKIIITIIIISPAEINRGNVAGVTDLGPGGARRED